MNQEDDNFKKCVEEGFYPQYLYKYRVSDINKNKHFDSILQHQELMFSSPLAFNDPFDCQLQPNLNPTKEQIELFYNNLNISDYTEYDLNDNKKTNLIENTLKNPIEFSKILKEIINFENNGVLCLSKEPDNINLWSHYADCHFGVCLKFDVLKDIDFFTTLLNVNYVDEYPSYNHMIEQNKIVEKMIKSKYINWKLENEVRIVKNKYGKYKFKKDSLVEIIFGHSTSESESSRIRELAKVNNLNHLKFKKAIKNHTQYKLDIFDY